jgi:uncharacterized membrane protein
MTDISPTSQEDRTFRAVLHPHRSLQPNGFLILMAFLFVVSFVTGVAFMLMGAWPVLGFFGLDILLIYIAFKLNYRAGRAYELVELTPEVLKITQVAPSGSQKVFDFNPYWARVLFSEWPDGRSFLRIASHGREFEFARFLNTDEKKDFANALQGALVTARAGGAF